MKTKQDEITIRKSNERGQIDHGWLKTHHSFSFANYYDPAHMGFRSLRVINDDKIAPNGGFPMHPHSNMEIFSYIVSGSISHTDNMGNTRTLKSGEVQLMSAGSGIKHSEFNPSSTEELHLIQIWLTPNQQNLNPNYSEWKPSEEEQNEPKTLIISPDGKDASVTINQDVEIYRIKLKTNQQATHKLPRGRGIWIQVISGSVKLNTINLEPGDAASTEKEGFYTFTANTETEFLLFDLA